MTPDNLSAEESRKGSKILMEAELAFQKRFYNHSSHSEEKAYWAYEGCDECFYDLIKKANT